MKGTRLLEQQPCEVEHTFEQQSEVEFEELRSR
jgi:hypothetical protein